MEMTIYIWSYIYEGLLACMLVGRVCNVQWSQRPEEGVRCSGATVRAVMIANFYVMLRIEPVPFPRVARVASAFNETR